MKQFDPRILVSAAVAVLFSSAGQGAEEDSADRYGSVGGSLLLSSNYMFRGISNSNDRAQVRGDLTWSHDVGLYAGVWASNTNFGGAGNSMELDPYIGFAGEVEETPFSYDIGFWSYNYPGSEFDLDYQESYLVITYEVNKLSVSPSFWYADNYFGKDFLNGVSAFAYDLTLSYEFPLNITFSGVVGRQTFGSSADELDYTYYSLALSRTCGDFSFELSWHDTNGVEPFLADPELADGAVVVGVTRNF